jgi:hypothetical protein
VLLRYLEVDQRGVGREEVEWWEKRSRGERRRGENHVVREREFALTATDAMQA